MTQTSWDRNKARNRKVSTTVSSFGQLCALPGSQSWLSSLCTWLKLLGPLLVNDITTPLVAQVRGLKVILDSALCPYLQPITKCGVVSLLNISDSSTSLSLSQHLVYNNLWYQVMYSNGGNGSQWSRLEHCPQWVQACILIGHLSICFLQWAMSLQRAWTKSNTPLYL